MTDRERAMLEKLKAKEQAEYDLLVANSEQMELKF